MRKKTSVANGSLPPTTSDTGKKVDAEDTSAAFRRKVNSARNASDTKCG